MEWSTDVWQADWWLERMGPWTHDLKDLRHIVPGGFDAIGRIFHPIESEDGDDATWKALAERNGRTPHAQMQLHAIGTPAGTACTDACYSGPTPRIGELPPAETDALAAVLNQWTSTPMDCWFGVWDGYGQLHGGGAVVSTYADGVGSWRSGETVQGLAPQWVSAAPRVVAPGRAYFLMTGALADIEQACQLIGGQSPNLWWPADRSWFVISEIDFAWTYVAGPAQLVEAIATLGALEVWVADYSHGATVLADQINT